MADGTFLWRVSVSISLWMTIFVVVGCTTVIAWLFYQQHDPIITTSPPHIVPDHIAAGGVMHIEADFVDRAVCSTDTGRFLWRYSTNPIPPGQKPRKEYVILQSTHVAFSDPGVNHPVLDVQVPHWVDPGHWFYFARAERTCGLYDRVAGPDIGHTSDYPITIEPPISSAAPDSAYVPDLH